MKKRIKVDSSILSAMIILTGISFLFKDLHVKNVAVDNALDFLGVLMILKGTLFRMVARGHKKAHSNRGHELVIDGMYILTRNPMYLGSFLLGAGYILILWPWWGLPLFAVLFYLRFNKQMLIEEKHLSELFPKEYKAYCKKVPRLFPKFETSMKVKTKDIMSLDEAMDTKEVRGLVTWPVLAFFFELFQQLLLFGNVDVPSTFVLFVSAIVVFNFGFILIYQFKS